MSEKQERVEHEKMDEQQTGEIAGGRGKGRKFRGKKICGTGCSEKHGEKQTFKWEKDGDHPPHRHRNSECKAVESDEKTESE